MEIYNKKKSKNIFYREYLLQTQFLVLVNIYCLHTMKIKIKLFFFQCVSFRSSMSIEVYLPNAYVLKELLTLYIILLKHTIHI